MAKPSAESIFGYYEGLVHKDPVTGHLQACCFSNRNKCGDFQSVNHLKIPAISHTEKYRLGNLRILEAATGGVLSKKVFLQISQNSQENTCARLSFNKVSGLCHRCSPVNIAKFIRTPIQSTSKRLLLVFQYINPVQTNFPFPYPLKVRKGGIEIER